MPVKTKPVGPAGNRLLEPSDEELLAPRHLRTVIRERVDWHTSRRDHEGHYRVYLPTVRETGKNAILIVEFAKENFEKGMNLVEAAKHAAAQRLRPILMTSFAHVMGVK